MTSQYCIASSSLISLEPSETQQRCSSRPGKGSGGRLQQLRRIERAQTTRSTRQSRDFDDATQGQPLNPMAPSDLSDDEEQESQIPPWASQSRATEELQFPVHQPQPSFKPSVPGDNFGFKLPSTHGTQSINSNSLSVPSSRSPSIYSPPVSRTGSTAPTSYVPSECGSNSAYVTHDKMEDFQPAPPRRTSQLRTLAAASSLTDPPPRKSCVERSFSQPSFSTFQDQAPARDDSPPPQRVGLRRTQTFSRLPSTIPPSHTMFMADTGIEADAIDETSPSEDERLAMSIVRGESKCQAFK